MTNLSKRIGRTPPPKAAPVVSRVRPAQKEKEEELHDYACGIPAEIQTRPPKDQLLGYMPGETVTIAVTVSVRVVEGSVRSGELEQWVREALERYYTFRAGFMSGPGGVLLGISRAMVRRIDTLP